LHGCARATRSTARALYRPRSPARVRRPFDVRLRRVRLCLRTGHWITALRAEARARAHSRAARRTPARDFRKHKNRGRGSGAKGRGMFLPAPGPDPRPRFSDSVHRVEEVFALCVDADAQALALRAEAVFERG